MLLAISLLPSDEARTRSLLVLSLRRSWMSALLILAFQTAFFGVSFLNTWISRQTHVFLDYVSSVVVIAGFGIVFIFRYRRANSEAEFSSYLSPETPNSDSAYIQVHLSNAV